MVARETHRSVAPVSFEKLTSYWLKPRSLLKWDCIFVTPPWLEVWWREFGSSGEQYLCAVKKGGATIGIAPLLIKEEQACLMGSADVCDCLDFVIKPGSEHDFFDILLDDLMQREISRLSLRTLRPDSTVLTHLVGIAQKRNYEVSCAVEDVSLELDLPPSWEEYLVILNQKQRHEVRRKLRRLQERGEVGYRIIADSEALPEPIDWFLRFFRESREDKALFMTTERESFFRSLAMALAQAGLLKMCIVELDAQPVAAVMCLDYRDTVYLYNSGYAPQYSSLSVGLVSKILCIKDTIQRGGRKFDFLKGAEEYKYRLGGKEVPLHGCEIVLR